ncbi:glucose-1-phosphate thymidylyltransferase [Thermomonospora echinospora]|uniref:Glucose-1-phosphate thymidylyltransferase n=1 Tax=Thermomonospora echinospora TaxID=1992 RepID=A0A1H6DEC5_9ACTN|nr:glucose-1-phosphate thymidylyltransferase RfbA [Thermomonospora echinospora]SEG83639.1 glucose-1-phosphate thymidylyltransferase [Thermomonospora echinospora]
MKGIVLAGGSGTRLRPLTGVLSKQILPVYNKPMIYYPLSVLMLAGIRDILIVSSPRHLGLFRGLLGDGSRLGVQLSYAEQPHPGGIAEALLIGAGHIGDDSVALVLGDNLFHGPGFSRVLQSNAELLDGCTLFGYPVRDPERYGIAEIDDRGRLVALREKPADPRSNLAVTGLYMYDNDVVDIARGLTPSARGELEITDVNRAYLDRRRARLVELGRGFVWLDTGTHDSLLEAGQYVQMLEQRQGVRIACLEEIAYRMGYIGPDQCLRLAREQADTDYGTYLIDLVEHGTYLIDLVEHSTAGGRRPPVLAVDALLDPDERLRRYTAAPASQTRG